MKSLRKFRTSLIVGATLAATIGGVFLADGAGADPFVPHSTLVPEIPSIGFPIILGTPQYVESNQGCTNCLIDREVFAADQSGQYIISGGNFMQIELQNGSVLAQQYFAAFNISSKQIVCPNQLTFNGVVRSVEPGFAPNTVFVGGEFTKVAGSDGVLRTRNKVALVNLATCSVDLNFISLGANGRVDEITLSGPRLFVGGDFTAIGGASIRYVAELDAITGAVKPAFNLTFGTTSLSGKVRGMGASPDGTKLIFGGRFGTVSRNGVSLSTQTAVVDISNAASPVLTNHTFIQTHPEFTGRPLGQSMQDVSISPDGTKIGLAYGTATVSDYVYLVNANAGTQSALWQHYMQDTSMGIAVSNNAVYVSGHFCRINPGPGATDMMTPKMGLDQCSGSSNGSNVWRTHMAALSITDGRPLTWNPGANSFVGGSELTVTSRGLLVGYDGDRINSYRVGALGFLDLGPGADTVAPSDVTLLSPPANATVTSPATVSGVATDNVAVVKYRVRVLASTGQWVQANGTLGATAYEFKPLPLGDGSFSVPITMPVGNYEVQSKAVDLVGLTSANWAKRSFAVGTAGARMAGAVGVLDAAIVEPMAVAEGEPLTFDGEVNTDGTIAEIRVSIVDEYGNFVQDDLTLGESPNQIVVAAMPGNGKGRSPWRIALPDLPGGDYWLLADVADTRGNIVSVTARAKVHNVRPDDPGPHADPEPPIDHPPVDPGPPDDPGKPGDPGQPATPPGKPIDPGKPNKP